MNASKITIAKEVIEALVFLGIPTEKFAEIKKEHGGLIELHTYLATQL
jgi:hypothetical protein